MNKTIGYLLSSVAGLALMASAASADNHGKPAHRKIAYLEFHGGFKWGDETSIGSRFEGALLGLSGHLTKSFSPHFSLQIDGWAEGWAGRITECSSCKKKSGGNALGDAWGGLAIHLIKRPTNQTMVGAMVSAGHTEERFEWFEAGGGFVAAALQGALQGEWYRVYGQAGYVHGVGGRAASYNSSDYYGQLVATIYPTDRTAISVNFGADRYEASDYDWNAITWGARLEMQAENQPVTFFLAYQGRQGEWNDGYTFENQIVSAGITFLIHAPDIRTRDRENGAADYNPLYGKTFKK